MIRILQCVNDMNRAGLETMLMNYYKCINRNEFQFDFLTHRPYKGDYDDEIISMGGKIYYAPRLYPQKYAEYFRFMKDFWKQHPEYKIVHSHIDAMSYFPLLSAKKAGIPVRIAHSHSTSVDRDFKYFLKLYYKHKLIFAATDFCACGEEAGRFLFPNKNFKIIPNAVEAEKFYFNSYVR
ncbi:MAG: glycosyltransferase, partial [Clostridiales bacterium]|nr:glycosyltransferase [Clostridiales bacterium]